MAKQSYIYLVVNYITNDYQVTFENDSDVQRIFFITNETELEAAKIKLTLTEITEQDDNKSRSQIAASNRSSYLYKDLFSIKKSGAKILNIYKFENMPYCKRADIKDKILQYLIDNDKLISEFVYDDLFPQ